jgi:hypothetical protein
MKDQMNDLHFLPVITPASPVTTNTTITSLTVDRLGFDALTFALVSGEIASSGALISVVAYHGDQSNMSDETAVDLVDILGQSTSGFSGSAAQNKTRKMGYIGNKRYVRLKLTTTSNSGNIFLSAVAVLGKPSQAPTINPPMP